MIQSYGQILWSRTIDSIFKALYSVKIVLGWGRARLVESGKGRYFYKRFFRLRRTKMQTRAKRAKRFEKGSGIFQSELQSIHRISLSVSFWHVPLSKLHFSPTLLFSPNAILSSSHSMLFSTAIHPCVHVLRRLPLNPGAASATFLYASACTTIKPEKDFSFPFLSAHNYMRYLPRRKVKRLSKCRPVYFLWRNPQMLCFFCFLCLAPHSCEIP